MRYVGEIVVWVYRTVFNEDTPVKMINFVIGVAELSSDFAWP